MSKRRTACHSSRLSALRPVPLPCMSRATGQGSIISSGMKRALLLLLILSCSASAAELRVSAAASLTDVLQELGAFYQQRTGTRVVFNFGASGMLARQIIEGAPADDHA